MLKKVATSKAGRVLANVVPCNAVCSLNCHAARLFIITRHVQQFPRLFFCLLRIHKLRAGILSTARV